MQTAERLDKIHPSMTLAINARAMELRAKGLAVISLAVGEPDFPTPQFIKDAAKKAIDDNFTRYTPVPGIPELRKACAGYFERHYKAALLPENIIAGAGGKYCLYTLMQAALNPGDDVLIPAPYWVSYPAMAILAGANPVFVNADAAAGFKISAAMLEKARTPKTKMLVINSPSNPTGAVYNEAELAEIIEWAAAHNIFVVSDEIYDQLVFKPASMASAIHYLQKYPEQIAVVNGLSKSYAMTGWRVGFVAANADLIKKLALIQSHSLSNICSIGQKAAVAALEGPEECIKEMRHAFEKRRNLALDMIKGWEKAICPAPDGAFYLFIDMKGYYGKEIAGSMELCTYILEKALVAAVPGIAFGNDDCIRLSYAVSDETLTEALGRIGDALKEISGI